MEEKPGKFPGKRERERESFLNSYAHRILYYHKYTFAIIMFPKNKRPESQTSDKWT